MTHLVTVPHNFTPRDYQLRPLNALMNEGKRHIYLVMHRRAGKDMTCMSMLFTAACERVGLYFYLFPYHGQARTVIWDGMDSTGKKFIDRIHPDLIKKKNETHMTVTLLNGSIIKVAGSDNYDALVGAGAVGVVYSEFPLHSPFVRERMIAMMLETKGWEILQGTPRGQNHAYQTWMAAQGDPDWHTELLTIKDTHREDGSFVITEKDLDFIRASGVSEETIQQDYYCNWTTGVTGAYYTEEMQDALNGGRITSLAINPSMPCWTFWDIGISDATSIWIMQPRGYELYFVAYYENSGYGIDHYIDYLQQFSREHRVHYESHYAGCDIATRSFSSGKSPKDVAFDRGFLIQQVGRKMSGGKTMPYPFEEGIQAVKSVFYRCHFDEIRAKKGITCLREYRRLYDENRKVFKEKHLHDWASNCADAFRYFALAWRDLYAHPDGHSEPFRYRVDI